MLTIWMVGVAKNYVEIRANKTSLTDKQDIQNRFVPFSCHLNRYFVIFKMSINHVYMARRLLGKQKKVEIYLF